MAKKSEKVEKKPKEMLASTTIRTYMDSFFNTELADKTIMRSYDWVAELHLKLKSSKAIKPHHFVNIDIPTYSFNRESVSVGAAQYSHPVLAKEQNIDVKFTLEEDRLGRVSNFIQELQRSVVDNGFHQTPNYTRLGYIDIYLLSNSGIGANQVVTHYRINDVFFLGAELANLTYDNSESMKFTITMGSDYLLYDNVYV